MPNSPHGKNGPNSSPAQETETNHSEATDPHTVQEDAFAEEERHWSEKGQGQEPSEIEQILERGEATLTLAAAWFQNLTTLAQLELNRTVAASTRIAALLLMLLPLAIALVVSLCGALGLVGYYFTQSIYIGFGIFLLAQLLLIVAIVLYLRRLQAMLGFAETRKQTREALNDVSALFK